MANSRSVGTTFADTASSNYDTPWKIALERHFQHFMAFYFPNAHAQIDWTTPHEFLDMELQAITKSALVGTRHVDKLVKVRLLSGQEEWLCIHIEVQIAREQKFARRMFVYNYRLFDRYDQPVASMAVLGDDDPTWLPGQYGYQALDCEMRFRFPIAKLAQFAGQHVELATHPNPFALLTLAYLHNRATAQDMAARYAVKCQLIRQLLARQWEGSLIREFFQVIDWMMALPPEWDQQLSEFISELEQGNAVEYVNTIERVLLAKTRQETESAMLKRLLTRRFGDLPDSVQARLRAAESEQIETWFDQAISAATLDAVFQGDSH